MKLTTKDNIISDT